MPIDGLTTVWRIRITGVRVNLRPYGGYDRTGDYGRMADELYDRTAYDGLKNVGVRWIRRLRQPVGWVE